LPVGKPRISWSGSHKREVLAMVGRAQKSRDSSRCSLTNLQQAPVRNANTIGASVYSHTGEFAPSYTDLELPGRGLDLQFIRSYRSSLADHIGQLGRGWSSSIAKKIEREGDDIIIAMVRVKCTNSFGKRRTATRR